MQSHTANPSIDSHAVLLFKHESANRFKSADLRGFTRIFFAYFFLKSKWGVGRSLHKPSSQPTFESQIRAESKFCESHESCESATNHESTANPQSFNDSPPQKQKGAEKPILALIVPFFNEREIIESSLESLSKKLESLQSQIHENSFIVLINDGSSDDSPRLAARFITQRENQRKNIVLINLARNFGHQSALLCGYEFARGKCDCAISIDCDLEQDINAIEAFLRAYENGADIALGVRENRASDGVFKKFSALFFYKFMAILGAKILKNHADYRLLSRRALEILAQFGERNMFLRGMILELGLKSEIVKFRVKPRTAGKSKYSLRKMCALALDGITSFSIAPLRLIFAAGVAIASISAVLGIYGIFVAIWGDSAVPGWASIVVPIYFLGGVQMLSLGIIGEYVGKNYIESKRRPRYIIRDIVDSR